MRKLFVLFKLIGLLAAAAPAGTFLEIPVEIVAVRNLGISDEDESKSVIEVRWKTDPVQKEKIGSYRLLLSVTYADGTKLTEKTHIDKNANSVRVEVPSVKTFGGRPSAFIKTIDAEVTAIISKNTNQETK